MSNFMGASFFGAVCRETTLFVRRQRTQDNPPGGAECACSVERSCTFSSFMSKINSRASFFFPFQGRPAFRVHPGCLCRTLPPIPGQNHGTEERKLQHLKLQWLTVS